MNGFNSWNTQRAAQDSLDAANLLYGCPVKLDNGYIMNEWAIVTKSDSEERWGWERVEARFDKTTDELEAGLEVGRVLESKKPDNWDAKGEMQW